MEGLNFIDVKSCAFYIYKIGLPNFRIGSNRNMERVIAFIKDFEC